ncbi:MAG: family 16 glycosylhydrolase [Bacteroidota bacterium]
MKQLFFLFLIGMLMVSGCGDGGTDPPPPTTLPRLSITNVTLFEGNTGLDFTFQVLLSQSSTDEVRVDYATDEVTAVAGTDYTTTQGTLVFSAGETQKNIVVPVLADTLRENDDQFKVTLSNPVNATINSAEGLGTIRNDDTFIDVGDDGYTTPESYPNYTLVWADEFNGSELDLDSWSYETGASGWGNNELQNYQEGNSNAFLTDGNLAIEAREETGGYTSARLITAGKKEFMFGRVDIRAKLPEGQGIWPALWMLGENFWDIGWPACGEIDIMELVGHEPNKVHGTLHWGPEGNTTSIQAGNSYTLPNGRFSDMFHVFSLVWEFDNVKIYIDDILYMEATPATVSPQNYPFNQPFFFIFNVAVGGNWPGSPDASTEFPQRMFVDYIRVFQ